MHLFHTKNIHLDAAKFPQIGKTRGCRIILRHRRKDKLWRIIRIRLFERGKPNLPQAKNGSKGTLSFEIATFLTAKPKMHSLRDMVTYKAYIRLKFGLGGKKYD